MKKGRFLLQGTAEELITEVNGMVWSCRVPSGDWPSFENRHTIANSRNLGNVVEARVISPFAPCADCEQTIPTLEDLYLKCFADEQDLVDEIYRIRGKKPKKGETVMKE